MTLWKRIFPGRRKAETIEALRNRLVEFRELVEQNNRVLQLIADAGEKLGGEYIFDSQFLKTLAHELETAVRHVIYNLNTITGRRHSQLVDALEAIRADVHAILEGRRAVPMANPVMPIEKVDGELADIVGEKMARLGEIGNKLRCRIPDGFVISAYACSRVLQAAGIDEGIDEQSLVDGTALADRSAKLRERVRGAELPRSLDRAIGREITRLKKKRSCQSLAVRSSAFGEDGEMSFAGQYQTLLGISPDRVSSAYKEVLASLYSPHVMRYRQSRGLHPTCGAMAVGCLCMVDASASGVLYTLDPEDPQKDVLLVSAARGLGKLVVEGIGATDRYEISRDPPHEIRFRSVVTKEEMYIVEPNHGIGKAPVPNAERDMPAVSEAQLRELAATALSIENYMKCAQDIEWAVDAEGQIFVLQARPLRLAPSKPLVRLHLTDLEDRYSVLLKNRGEIACRGIGIGRVHIITGDEDLDRLPHGAVLVARSATPQIAAAMRCASAILTDVGTTTGHLAALAREYRVPAIVDMEKATQVLKDAEEITVDAEKNAIYRGSVPELMRYQLLNSASYAEKPEFRLLRKMLNRIAPLNLKDPQSPDFSAHNCTTYHDIIRFAHEKAVDQFTRGYWVRPASDSPYIRHLDLDIPLDLVLVDLGGGFQPRAGARALTFHDVTSTPLLAVLKGLTSRGVWPMEPAAMDLDGFMASATRSPAIGTPLASRPERNMALVSDQYLHLSLKLGYHFNIIDGYLSKTRNDNYIYFRFAGGVTEMIRRSRRATLLKRILEKYDFVVEGKQDLIIARIKKISEEAMVDRLTMIGRLIGFTRQLDICLRDDSTVEQCVHSFLTGDYNPFQLLRQRSDEMARHTEVMVLDDEPIVCERLKRYLEKNGLSVETFTRSQEAIDRLAEKTFDVVITDLKMEGPTGLDVLHFIRNHMLGTQVIIMTGYATFEAAREAEYTGVYDFIPKPFRMESIGAVVKKAARKAKRLQKRANR